jgi:hypothetical protein
MRRLAKDTRNDTYGSRRDYQTLLQSSVEVVEFNANKVQPAQLVLAAKLSRSAEYMGFGAYIKPDKPCVLRLSVTEGDLSLADRQYNLDPHWKRIGAMFEFEDNTAVRIRLQFDGGVEKVCLWGVDCDGIVVPPLTSQPIVVGDVLDKITTDSLCPETYYLDASVPNALQVVTAESIAIRQIGPSAETIMLKKCPYCNRLLPVDPNRGGALSFDNHSAKKTLHQNECRACKKWRINDSLNKRRTKDQLHESSTLTREKKVLLREPEVLKRIKDRHSGKGLRTIIWERFDKKCFRCGMPVTKAEYELDHTRPLAYLWPLDEHATCLCWKCNNEKHDRFPADFYTQAELERLSRITGLGVNELTKRDVNEAELQRIVSDIGRFADELNPRTFASITVHVRSVRPETDLLGILKAHYPAKHLKIMAALAARPK